MKRVIDFIKSFIKFFYSCFPFVFLGVLAANIIEVGVPEYFALAYTSENTNIYVVQPSVLIWLSGACLIIGYLLATLGQYIQVLIMILIKRLLKKNKK